LRVEHDDPARPLDRVVDARGRPVRGGDHPVAARRHRRVAQVAAGGVEGDLQRAAGAPAGAVRRGGRRGHADAGVRRLALLQRVDGLRQALAQDPRRVVERDEQARPPDDATCRGDDPSAPAM
jgi:hypothetical protein